MKKIISLFLSLMVVFSGLLVINFFQTKDQERLESIDQTTTSFKIYVSDTSQTASAMIQFFQKLSEEEKVSIVRTDFPENKVVKSVIANESTFPFQNFFQNSQAFPLFQSSGTIYSSDRTKNPSKIIPAFNASPVIELQSLQEYFKNKDKSATGAYNIIPLKAEDKERLLQRLADFFGISIDDLRTPKVQSRKEYINKDLLLYFGIFCILGVLTLLSVLSIPMMQVKSIGVWKLCGFTTKDVLKKLFLLPYLVVIGVSILFNVSSILYFQYLPRNFLRFLVGTQLLILLLLTVSVLLAYSLVRAITVVSLVKNSQKFNLGIGTMLFLKTVMVVLTTVLLIGSLTSMRDISKANEVYKKASSEGNFLTVEKLGFTTDETFKNFELNNGKNEEKMATFFSNLEETSHAFFLYGSIVNPVKNFSLYSPLNTFTVDDNYEVVQANKNYLTTRSLTIPNTNHTTVFLVPNQFKAEKEKITTLCKMIAFNRLEEQEQEKTSFEKIEVTLTFYENSPKTVTTVFLDNDVVTFDSPIYQLVSSDRLDSVSKIQLLTTGVTSPLRIENTQKNRDSLSKQLQSKSMKGINPTFSTIRSILDTDADSSRLALQFMVVLLLIVFSLSLIVSGFVCMLYFTTNKVSLSVQCLLGIKLFDRYKGIIFVWSMAYLVQIMIATIYSKSIFGLGIGLILTVLDILISVSILSYQENKNLVAVLKGE